MKWLLPIVLTTLTACSEEREVSYTCPTDANYSEAFLESDFYQGWRTLKAGEYPRENCKEAIHYFERGVSDNAVFELSTLYADFCSGSLDQSLLDHSSIYLSEKLSTGVDYDEFKWVLDLALCNSPVEQYALGQMLLNGFITDQDTEKGIYFLSLAAHQDHIQAQLALAVALEQIGEQDIAQRWAAKAHSNLTAGITQPVKNAE